jgi:raffinose/stachyose/melibiose transport system substrate-binding protein
MAFWGCAPKANDSAGGSDSGKTTIAIMFSGTPAAENDFETVVLPRLVEQQFPDLKLEVTKLPDDNYYTAIRTKLASGEAPDMFLIQPKYAGSIGTINLAKAGYLAPLTDLHAVAIAGAGGAESFSYNGDVYSIPSGVTILGTFYNKDVFNQYALQIPQTWGEFLEVCEALKQHNVQPIVMGDKDNYVIQFGLYQLAASIIYAKNPKYDDMLYTGETKFTDPGTWDTVLAMYKTLYDRGYIKNTSLGVSAQQAIQQFIDGEAAMIFDGNFNTPAIRGKGSAAFERGYFPLPGNQNQGETYAAMAVGGSPAIYSRSKNIDVCKKILEYWMDGESDLYQAMATNGKTIVTHSYGADQVDPLYTPFMELYNKNRSFYWCNQAWPGGVENEMLALFCEMIGGQKTTVNDIVKAMQAKFDDLTAD